MGEVERFAVLDPTGRVVSIVRLRPGENWAPDDGESVVPDGDAEVGWVCRDGYLRPPRTTH